MIFYEVAVLVKHLNSDYKGRRSIKLLDVPSMEIIEEYTEGVEVKKKLQMKIILNFGRV